jgi:hypothetical protein
LSNKPLKIFLDPSWFSGLNSFERLPLAESLLWHNNLFKDESHIDPFARDHFVRRINFCKVFVLCDLSNCDAILYPAKLPEHPYGKQNSLVQKVKKISDKVQKPVIVHTNTKDILNPSLQVGAPFRNFLYFNTSLVENRTRENFFPAPYFVPDIYLYRNQPPFLKDFSLNIPSVGFCGFAPPLKQHWCKTKFFDFFRMILCILDNFYFDSEEVARRLGTNIKHAHRIWSIYLLKNDNRIKTNFILRSAGALQDKSYYKGHNHKISEEYYNNIEKNLYNLTSRGTENYSIRFYETFCFGRIPIMVDTDLVLPFNDLIDYNRHCVMIKKDQLLIMPKILMGYHRKHFFCGSSNIQIENRRIWEKYFSPIGFYKQASKLIREYLQK